MEAIKTRPLGRGLASLLGVEEETRSEGGPTIHFLPVEELTPGKYQPRQHMDEEALDALVASIREKGVLQPILIRSVQHATAVYEIVAGERRWQAAQKAGLTQVPVIIKELSDQEALETALIENIQRDDLTPLEEAEGYQRLMDEFHYTQESVAKVVGKSRSHLANMLRLLSLSPLIKSYLQNGKLSAGHARSLIGYPEADVLATEIIQKKLSVRETERRMQASRSHGSSAKKIKAYDEDCLLLEETITKACGITSQLSLSQNQYKLTLICKTMGELDKIIQKLCHS